ncbi:NnrU family protein [Pararhodobacter zhoushanensis]|uniref:NnrU family protein n=1 Tax=Pararhodobacter zhoushanensis TaxID=2479545 RepID=A0ABT3H562_9RHOB|nr:NnrU family protein [Pararhodobacter zhoushanensis]MCW1934830.1 NnrU family protein [Pararhodobacter zhoushanensis]
MDGWGSLVAAMAVFVGAHRLMVWPRVKAPLVARLGAGGFTLAYSALSVALLVWVIVAAARSPFVPLWSPAAWQAWAALALMLVGCVLVAQALAGVNPFSFGSRTAPFDPERPGIAGVTRHPVLLALALWALAHTLANGDLAHVLLFAPMGLFALLGMAAIDRRKRRVMPDWNALSRNTALLSLRGVAALPLWPSLAGVAAWAALIALHPLVIGADPLGWLR